MLRRYHKRPELIREEPEKKVAGAEETNIAYNDLTVPELKEKVKNKGIVGYSNMTKGELIEILEGD